MKSNKCEIEPLERSKHPFSHGISLALVSTLICAITIFLHPASIPQNQFLANNTSPLKAHTVQTQIEQNARHLERTFIMLKPDAVQRGLIGDILKRFEAKGFRLIGLKIVWPSKELIEEHYQDSVGREHFSRLVKFMCSGPVIPMVWEGLNAVKIGRQLMGPSDPVGSMPGTIRADFSIDRERSIIHGSDTLDSAKREINLWFNANELVSWTQSNDKWLYN